MRKPYVLIIILFVLCCIGGTQQIHAVYIERLTDSTDYAAVVRDAGDEVVSEVNSIGDWEGSGVVGSITAEDIDWSKCYKNYIDEEDIFAQFDAQDSMDTVAEAMDYIWVLPLTVGKKDIYVILSIGEPLSPDEDTSMFTEEDLKLIEEEAGHWTVNSVSIGTRSADAIESQLSGTPDEKALYVGGTVKMRSGFALMEDDDELMVQLTAEPLWVAQEVNSISINANNSTMLSENQVYSFTEVQDVFSGYVVDNTGVAVGGAGRSTGRSLVGMSQFFIIAMVLLSGLGIFSFGSMKKI